MPQIVELNNGSYLQLMCFEDALEAVEELGGWELRDFIEEYMQDNIDDAAADRLEAEEARKGQETMEEKYRDVVHLVQSGLEKLMEKLNEDDPDIEDMRSLIKVICGGIEDVL